METLPFDIILIIISKANLETRIQCRRVCKSWLAALSDPAILQSLSWPKCLFLHSFVHNSESRSIHLHSLETLPSRHNAILKLRTHVKPSARDGTITIVGSCNGLLCEYHQEHLGDAYFCVSNPITGGSVTIAPQGKRRGHIGFGFSPDTNQYKLVELVHNHELEARVVTLCSSGKPRWRRVQCMHSYKYKTFRAFEIGRFLNGALHWWNVVESEILVFDLQNEQFTTLPPPPKPRPDVDHTWFGFTSLRVIKNCLTICCYWNTTYTFSCREIWAMKDYGIRDSWIRVREFKEDQLLYEGLCWRHNTRGYMRNLRPLMLYKTRNNKEMTLCMRSEGGYEKLYASHSLNDKFSFIDLSLPDFEAIADYVPTFLSLKQLL